MRLLRETVISLCISLCLAGFSCQKGQPYLGAQDGGAGAGGSGLAGSAGPDGTGGSTDAAVEGVVDAHADEIVDAPIESVVAMDAPVEGVVDAHVDGAADALTDHGGADDDVVVSCRALDDPTNGTVMTPGLTSGSVARYACALGFSLDGCDACRTCQSDGTWSGAAPTCATVTCPSLSAPTGGMISAPTVVYQSTATYSCNTGHILSGGATRTCQSDGSWTGTAPSCNLVQVSVSVTLKGPLGQGSVLATTPGVDINCGSTCSAIVTYGTTVQLVPLGHGDGYIRVMVRLQQRNWHDVRRGSRNDRRKRHRVVQEQERWELWWYGRLQFRLLRHRNLLQHFLHRSLQRFLRDGNMQPPARQDSLRDDTGACRNGQRHRTDLRRAGKLRAADDPVPYGRSDRLMRSERQPVLLREHLRIR